jgi:predicted ATP-grasp superfamily ATP-dependent carboligase
MQTCAADLLTDVHPSRFQVLENREFPTHRALKRPVLVLGWISRIVVAVARSLRKQGIPVDAATFVPSFISSRAIGEFRRVPHPNVDPAGFVSRIRDYMREGRHDTLIPADDQALMAVTHHYADLNAHVQLACPPPEITSLVLNKALTLQVAQKCGVPTPRSQVIFNSAELHDSVSTMPFPWILKPSKKEMSVEEVKSLTLSTRDQIALKFPKPQDFSPPMLLQEFCQGIGVGIELLIHDGVCRAVFQHRRLKEFPETGGVSVTAIAEQPNSELVDMARTLLRALSWEGPAMVEFKVDPVNGRVALLEVNGRYWGTLGLPIAAGMDFPFYHWQVLHGEQPSVPEKYSVGTRWRWTAGHLARLNGLLVAAWRSRAARSEVYKIFYSPSSFFDTEVDDPLVTTSDPMPAVFDLAHILRYLVASDIDSLIKGFFKWNEH